MPFSFIIVTILSFLAGMFLSSQIVLALIIIGIIGFLLWSFHAEEMEILIVWGYAFCYIVPMSLVLCVYEIQTIASFFSNLPIWRQ